MSTHHALLRQTLPIVIAMLAPMSAAADDALVGPDMELLALHQDCSSAAATRGLPPGEAQLCAANYLLLKLSFLPDIGLEEYHALGFAERYAVSQRGYAAYRAWQAWQSGQIAQAEDGL